MSDPSGQTVAPAAASNGAVRPRSALLRPRAYVPLAVLLVLSLVMAVIGAAASQRWIASPGSGPASTPATCRSDITPGDPTIWTGEQVASSEAVFAENTGNLTVPVVAGRDGFAFWSDVQANNFSTTLGRAPWLDEQRDQWRDYFADLRAGLERDGTELIVVVAPSVGTIYPEMLPEWADPLRGRTQLDQLLEVSGDLPIVDVRGVLRDAAEDRWVYSAVNSHWNPYGASVAWAAVSECLRALYPESGYEDLAETTAVEVNEQEPPNEFAEWGFEAPRRDWLEPTFEDAVATATVTGSDAATSELVWPDGIDMLDLPVTTTGGAIDRTALVVGDSQATALSALWAGSFSTTTQIRHFLEDASQRANVLDAARAADADLVVFEMTERYLSLPAPTILN